MHNSYQQSTKRREMPNNWKTNKQIKNYDEKSIVNKNQKEIKTLNLKLKTELPTNLQKKYHIISVYLYLNY